MLLGVPWGHCSPNPGRSSPSEGSFLRFGSIPIDWHPWYGIVQLYHGSVRLPSWHFCQDHHYGGSTGAAQYRSDRTSTVTCSYDSDGPIMTLLAPFWHWEVDQLHIRTTWWTIQSFWTVPEYAVWEALVDYPCIDMAWPLSIGPR